MNDPSTRYRLVRQLGAGGMAQVVEGVALGAAGFERRVAIKWILPELAGDESIRKMFMDEARIASRLHHANVVQVIDYGVMGGTEFIVFEFVDGLDMSRARRSSSTGTVPTSVALHVAAEVAHALDFAHRLTDAGGASMNVVHRDVSPANVLVSWEGDVKLSDFGIALFESREEQTELGHVKGKASYMAPELLRGERATPAADVYALGLTLHSMLTGTTGRYLGEKVDTSDRPPIDDDVRALIDACGVDDPKARPDAAELARRLGLLRASRTVESGRAELRAWLAESSFKKTPVTAMDPFAGRLMVGDSSRVFELTEPSSDAGTLPTMAARPSRSEPEPEVREVREGAERGWARVVIPIVLLLLAGGGGAWWFSSGEEEPEEVASADSESPETPPSAAPAEPVRWEVDAAMASIRPQPDMTVTMRDMMRPSTMRPSTMRPDTVRSSTERMNRSPMMSAAVSRLDMGSTDMGPTDMEPTEPAMARAMGSLRLGGARLVRGRVFIDGRPVGQAPNLFRLRVGSHELRVESLDSGEVLLARTIEIRDHHTDLAPLRVISR